MDIHADSNSSYDPPEAIRVGRLLEDIGAVYYEEPCPFDHLEDTKTVADALAIPVSGGEQESSQRRFRWMIANRGVGSIVNVASISAQIVNRPQQQANYNASKAGVAHFTRSCAAEWADRGVRVNSISPGHALTPMTAGAPGEMKAEWVSNTPMGRLCRPEDLQGAVVYLASDAAGYVTQATTLSSTAATSSGDRPEHKRKRVSPDVGNTRFKACSRLKPAQPYFFVTFEACRPLGPWVISNSTSSPSVRDRKPSDWIAV